jgi:hypothetical protein
MPRICGQQKGLTPQAKFNYFFDKVLAASPDIVDWLKDHHSLLCSRSKFSLESKCDYIK